MGRADVVVFAGGSQPPRRIESLLPAGAVVVGADRGAEHALGLGLEVDVAVGDFDSVSPEALERLETTGTRVERHPAAKNASDLELALDVALAFGPARILVVGGVAGRLDHLLGELLLLGADAYAGVELDAVLGRALVQIVRGERLFEGRPWELVSLFALNGSADGIRTEGLLYPLRGERLVSGSSRGLSNVFEVPQVRVEVARGVVAVVRPGRRATASERRVMRGSSPAGSASSSPPRRGPSGR